MNTHTHQEPLLETEGVRRTVVNGIGSDAARLTVVNGIGSDAARLTVVNGIGSDAARLSSYLCLQVLSIR